MNTLTTQLTAAADEMSARARHLQSVMGYFKVGAPPVGATLAVKSPVQLNASASVQLAAAANEMSAVARQLESITSFFKLQTPTAGGSRDGPVVGARGSSQD